MAERTLLHTAAKMTEAEVSRCAESGFRNCGNLSGKVDQFHRIKEKLAARPGWQAAALAELLDPRLLGDRTGVWDGTQVVRRLVAEIKSSDQCDNVTEFISQEASSLKPTPLTRHIINERTCGDAIQLNAMAGMWTEWRFLTIVGKVDDRLHIVSGGEEPEFFEVDGQSEAFDIGRERFFVTLVRADARITARLMGPSRVTPRVWVYGARLSRLFGAERLPPACLEIDLRPQNDPSLEVYVDGAFAGIRPVLYLHPWEHSFLSDPGEHNVTILRNTPKGAQVLTALQVSDDQLQSNTGCLRLAFDFTDRDARRDVAVLPPLVSPSCAAAGLDAAGLHMDTERLLRRLGRSPKRAQAWADTMNSFASLVHQFSARDPVGASRGRMASDASLETGAAEFVRQGFHTLLTVELMCRNGSQSSGHVSLRAHRVDLTPMMGMRDPGVGLDLSEVLHTVTESVASPAGLDLALVGVLGRLFGEHYVRFEHTMASRRFRGEVLVRFDAYSPGIKHDPTAEAEPKPYRVTLEARFLERSDMYLCAGPRGRVQIRSDDAAEQWWSAKKKPPIARTNHPIKLAPKMEVVETAEWNPPRPGVYLLRLLLQDQSSKRASGASVAYRCVDVVEPPARFWADVGYGRGPMWTPQTEARSGTLGHGALLVGFAHRTAAGSNIDVGFTLGYGHAIHSRTAPPSWELPPDGSGTAPAYDPQGHLRLNWTRRSLLAGATVGYRIPAPLCTLGLECTEFWRALDFKLRFATLFDVGRVSTDNIDPALSKFLTRTDGLDLDMTSMLQGGVLAHISRDRAVYAAVTATLVGWDDFWLGGREQTSTQTTMTYDTALLVGGSIGVEADIW
jgi:hypothetical protein